MKEIDKLIEELFVHYPQLMSEEWFRELELAVYAEVERWKAIMDSAGIA